MFWVDRARVYRSDEACPSCGEVHGQLDNMMDMAIACTALTAQRVLGDPQIPEEVMRSVGLLPGTPAFVEHELEAALAMAEDALSLVPEIEAIFGPVLREAMRADEVYAAIERADRYWRSSSFSKGTASRVEDALTLSVATGVNVVSDVVLVDKVFRQRIIDGMMKASKYYSNEFFNSQVMPALFGAVEKALAGNQAGSVAGFRLVQTTLDARLKSVPYWNVVANAAASRAYHYGMARAGLALGREYYQFRAVMDERTTPLCTSLNGMQWRIDDAIYLMEKIASAEHPDDVKTIAPWITYEEAEGKSATELREMGVIVPPLHGRCRSTIVIV